MPNSNRLCDCSSLEPISASCDLSTESRELATPHELTDKSQDVGAAKAITRSMVKTLFSSSSNAPDAIPHLAPPHHSSSANKIRYTADDIGDSDQEFHSETDEPTYRFHLHSPTQPSAVTIWGEDGPIKGSKLVELCYKTLEPYCRFVVPKEDEDNAPTNTESTPLNFIAYMNMDMAGLTVKFRGEQFIVVSDVGDSKRRDIYLKNMQKELVIELLWSDLIIKVDQQAIDFVNDPILVMNPKKYTSILWGIDWFNMLGTLAKYPTKIDVQNRKRPRHSSPETLPKEETYFVGRTQVALKLVFRENTERLVIIDKRLPQDLYGKDLSYKEIGVILKELIQNDEYGAKRQLKLLKGHEPEIVGDIFFDFLNALMFGVEASRNNASLLTGVMTLELIANKKMTYEEAFSPILDCQYPMASLNGGPGKYTERRELIEKCRQNSKQPGLKSERQNPERAAVTLKEAMIIKNWLKMKDVIKNSKSQLVNDLIKKIDDSFDQLIIEEYFLCYKNFPINESITVTTRSTPT